MARRTLRFRLTLVGLLGAISVSGAAAPSPREERIPPSPARCTGSPDLILLHGKIYTGDPARPWAQALVVCGETIARVGGDAEVQPLAASGTRVVDLHGRLVVPGFNDAHVHLLQGAEQLVGVDLRPAKSAAEMARLLGDYARTIPKGRWILGGYWDHEAWPGRNLPTRALIDAATPDNPVFVQRLDGHMGVANSLALRLAKVDRATQAPGGGTVVRDATGDPAGVFKDNAMALVTRAIPPASLAETMEKAAAALRHAASLGVTSLQDMTATATQLQAYQRLRAEGRLTARLYSIQASTDGRGFRGLAAAGVATGFGDDWLRIGGRKLFADGSMGSGTAAFFAPYSDDPKTSGLLIQSRDELEKAVFEADAAGFQVMVHAIGDRANAMTLDVFEKLVKERGPRDRRLRIEHAQVVRPEDKKRFARLGVIASLQPSHAIDDMRWAERRIGKERARDAYNWKSFVDAGTRVAFGTDWYVEPLDPMLGLYAAVTRQFPDGTPARGWFPEERLTLAQAVDFYTAGSAYAEFADDRKGTLAAGKLADLVVLSRDLFSIPPREILETRPVLTIVGGRVVYEAEGATH